MKKVVKISFIFVFFILLMLLSSTSFGAQDFDIKITQNQNESTSSDVVLNIDITTSRIFDSLSSQAVQVIVGEESETNKWVDLGSGKNAIVLKKTYNYTVNRNGKVTVRVVSWNLEDKSDLVELASQSYEVSNIDKTEPIIEKIDIVSTTKNSICLNIIAKHSGSGIAKYTCSCDSISYNKTDTNSKFEISGLEDNKEYTFNITVEDKLGNKSTTSHKIKTQAKERVIQDSASQNVKQNTNQNINQNTVSDNNVANVATEENPGDNTISNKKLPEVGTRSFIILIVIGFLMIYVINKTKDRK